MPASQDAWAKPLADTLVDLFRVDNLDYIRTGIPTYDPATGQVTGSETVFASAGAITVSGSKGEGTTGADMFLEVWINTSYSLNIKVGDGILLASTHVTLEMRATLAK